MTDGTEILRLVENINLFGENKVLDIEILDYNYFLKHHSFEEISIYTNIIKDSVFHKSISKGNFFYFKFENICLLCNCCQTGSWTTNSDNKYKKMSITFENGTIYFHDKRCSGSLTFYKEKELLNIWDKKLGLDILSDSMTLENFNNTFKKSCKKTKSCKNIADVLIDQKIISGIGNCLRSDILYLANIDPNTPVKILSDQQFDRLFHNICKISQEKYMYKDKYRYKIYGKEKINGYPVHIFEYKKRKIYCLPSNQPD